MEQIKIDIVPAGISPVANASQFDNGRQIRFNLFNQGTPYTLTGAETVTMVVNGEEESITNTSDNYVIWDVAEEDCAEAGVIGCEIRIVLGSMLIGSQNFFLEVEIDPYNGKNIRTITVGPADICTFETTLPEPLQSVTVNVEATGGNGTPDNPIPINGYTEANITRCGVNLFDKDEVMDGYISDANGNYTYSNNRKCTDYIPIKGGEDYKILSEQEDSAWGAWYDSEKNYISGCAGYYVGGSTVKTAPANACFVRLTVWSNSSGNIDTFGLNYPATDTTYHAYNGDTVTIAFGQTVYGGVLDVTRGKLHNTFDNSNLSDLTGWTYGNGFFRTSALASIIKKPASQSTATNALCSIYNSVSWSACGDNVFEFAFNSSNGELIIKDSRYTDVPTFLAGVSGIPLVYELATPFDIDLTPVQIRALVGTNNVFADCGQSTVKYLKAGA